MSLQMFSDESKERGYRMAAIVVAPSAVAQLRRECARWTAPGSRRFHARKESNERRHEALASLTSMSRTVSVVMVETGASVVELERRRRVLYALAQWGACHAVSRWVIERDDSVLTSDHRFLSGLRRELEMPGLEYVHVHAFADPVLWAADLAAWSWTRGGQFRAAIEPLVVAQIRL